MSKPRRFLLGTVVALSFGISGAKLEEFTRKQGITEASTLPFGFIWGLGFGLIVATGDRRTTRRRARPRDLSITSSRAQESL